MKKFFIIHVCLLLCFASCTTKQYYDKKIVIYHNYPYPKPLYIDTTNCLLLTNERFDAQSFDTIHLCRLNRETEVELSKRIREMFYESDVRSGHATQFEYYPLIINNFFLCGKLNLQPNVKSLILLEYDEREGDYVFGYSLNKSLWLINIIDDKLCSLVWLEISTSYDGIHFSSRATTALNNRIFTGTHIYNEYFLIENIGQRDWNRYETKASAQYCVNENGYIQVLEKNDWKFLTDKLDNKNNNN